MCRAWKKALFSFGKPQKKIVFHSFLFAQIAENTLQVVAFIYAIRAGSSTLNRQK
jgi:hypothetical protein